jgi:hypothetical protein
MSEFKTETSTGMPWAGGKVAVDRLVEWALGEQKAGDVFAGLFAIEAEVVSGEARGVSGDGCAAVERIAAMGCQVDGGGYRPDHTHPIADLVATLVAQLDADDRALVADAGRAGIAPGGWSRPSRWLVPQRWVKPEAEAVDLYLRGKQGQHCPLVRQSSPGTIEENRHLYRRWWAALQRLAFLLSCRPLGFVVVDPSADPAPWERGLDSRRIALA